MKDLETLLIVLSIIIGATSLLFAIFTAGIAAVAIFEWKSYWTFQTKRKESLIEATKELNELKKARESLVKDAKDIKDQNKSRNPEELKRITDLEEKIDKIIRKTEDKLSDIATSAPFLGGTGWITGATTTTSIGFGDRICARCRNLYYHPITSVAMDDGLCQNCKSLNIKL